MNIKLRISALFLLGLAPVAAQAQAAAFHQRGHTILREMVETNTTGSVGDVTVLATRLAAHFRDAGIPDSDIAIVGPTAKNRNLVVRYRGRAAGHRPILLLAHLDVVEAKRSDWSYDPFQLTERDGYYYGRGTQDQKGGAALLATTLIRLRQEKYVPDRDIILALTAGEEGGMGYDGVEWLIKNKRALIDAEYAINVDAGGGELENGKHALFDVQAAEKVYHSVALTARNPGGHSSLPRKDNAIYELARALDRLAAFSFPAKPNAIVKAYFAVVAKSAEPATAADLQAVANGSTDPVVFARLSASPLYNALLRTTCVATMLEGGHAENALPQSAKATVNCRMLPGDDPAAIERAIVRAVNDTAVHLTPIDTAIQSPPSPLRSDLFDVISATVKATWGPMPIVPTMETGATDGLYLRNAGTPVYGFSGMFIATDDDRMHGKDERILITSLDEGLDFTYDLVRRLTGSGAH